jgi:hypothetical protein
MTTRYRQNSDVLKPAENKEYKRKKYTYVGSFGSFDRSISFSFSLPVLLPVLP